MAEYDIGYPHSGAKRIITEENRRTITNKINAWRLDEAYYDGARENGYGGFQYDGRWQKILPRAIERYGLTKESAILDLGCKKGFIMNDLMELLPGVKVRGVENHLYPLENAMDSVKPYVVEAPYQNLPFEDSEFDFVIAFAAIYMLNLHDVMDALREIQRVGKGKSYITLGAYRSREGKELFLDWTLIGTTVLHVDEWLEVFKETGFTGDYTFVTAETLCLARA